VITILTFQDFQTAVLHGDMLKFIRDAIQEHRNSDAYKIARDADEYDAQRNVTINETVKRLYSISNAVGDDGEEKMNVSQHTDSTASNHHIASNFFHRLNTDRAAYSLGNGVTFDEEGVKDKLGPKFDTDLFNAGKLALKHGVTFCFWNLDRLHVFPLTEFVPLWDESDGSLKAGIRYWSIDWKRKPVYAVLYEVDGYTKFKSKGKSGLTLEEMEPKRAYRQTVAHTDAGGDEVIGEDNYSALPIVPLYGNEQHQSTLVGMRGAIDAYDLISSGYCNEVSDTAQIYWLIGNALGMTDDDVQHFMDRLRFTHAAAVDTENSTVTPYTQEPPYNAREAVLTRLARCIYRDFGAFNPEDVQAGNVTATQIRAAYQAQDIEADAFEYQVIECVQQILALQGLEGTPQFSRNRIANQLEEVNMVVSEAAWLDDETVLDLLPNITPDMKEAIMERKDVQDAQRLQSDDELEARVKAMVEDILKGQQTGAVEQDNNGGYRYVE
jgi:hypothetical protein